MDDLPASRVDRLTTEPEESVTDAIRDAAEAELNHRAIDAFIALRGKVRYDQTWQELRGKDEPDKTW